MSDQKKAPRAATTREETTRPKQWRPADLLPEPDKQPGYVYRWIRVSMLNNSDPRNVSAKLREGWEAVTVEEQPQFKLFVDPRSRFEGSIEIGGLLLCKAPEELMEQRRRHYQGAASAQMEAVDNNFMAQNDPRMPLFKDRKSEVSFGNGI